MPGYYCVDLLQPPHGNDKKLLTQEENFQLKEAQGGKPMREHPYIYKSNKVQTSG